MFCWLLITARYAIPHLSSHPSPSASSGCRTSWWGRCPGRCARTGPARGTGRRGAVTPVRRRIVFLALSCCIACYGLARRTVRPCLVAAAV